MLTDKTRLRRLPDRGSHTPSAVHAILDEGLMAHVGIPLPGGEVAVLPVAYVRIGAALYIHGSKGSRLLNVLAQGAPVCVTVTLLDGLVLAKSAFHHSMNYRSAIVYGRGTPVPPAAAPPVLDALMERLYPGRAREARSPSAVEMAQTLVVQIPITEASAKTREGGPHDDADDLSLPVWAGHVPLGLYAAAPIPCPAGSAAPLPDYLRSVSFLPKRSSASGQSML